MKDALCRSRCQAYSDKTANIHYRSGRSISPTKSVKAQRSNSSLGDFTYVVLDMPLDVRHKDFPL